MTTTATMKYDEISRLSYEIRPEAKKSWTFSHGYDGWEFYVNTRGHRLAVFTLRLTNTSAADVAASACPVGG